MSKSVPGMGRVWQRHGKYNISVSWEKRMEQGISVGGAGNQWRCGLGSGRATRNRVGQTSAAVSYMAVRGKITNGVYKI